MLKMESKFIGHEQCPKCGSKDNLARYSDGAHCFTPDCGYFEKGDIALHLTVATLRKEKEWK
jgi:ribosomal protein S27AE